MPHQAYAKVRHAVWVMWCVWSGGRQRVVARHAYCSLLQKNGHAWVNGMAGATAASSHCVVDNLSCGSSDRAIPLALTICVGHVGWVVGPQLLPHMATVACSYTSYLPWQLNMYQGATTPGTSWLESLQQWLVIVRMCRLLPAKASSKWRAGSVCECYYPL